MQLKVSDLAHWFQVDERAVHRWIRDENLPAHFVNEQYRFSRFEVIEWATIKRLPVPPSVLRASNDDAESVTLWRALELGGVHHSVEGVDKESVWRAAMQRIPVLCDAEREMLIDLLSARERLGTTAIGDGIAIPHPGQPLALAIYEPLVALCFLQHPQDFGARDAKPVYALFFAVTANVRTHTILLAQLGAALRDTAFHDAIQRRAAAAEIILRARQLSEDEQAAAVDQNSHGERDP